MTQPMALPVFTLGSLILGLFRYTCSLKNTKSGDPGGHNYSALILYPKTYLNVLIAIVVARHAALSV
jgi:hypothetical protein